jgi:hypothetical protein
MRVSLVRGVPVAVLAGVLVLLASVVVSLAGLAASAWAGCPNEEFRTGLSAGLPDCRAYELVSPPDKNGGEVDGGVVRGFPIVPQQAAVGGEAVTYASTSAFLESGSASALVASQYLSTRTGSGWETQAITPKQVTPGGVVGLSEGVPDWSLFQGFSEDLEHSFLLAWTPELDPAAPEGFFSPYLRDEGSGTYQLLSPETPPVQQPFAKVHLEVEGFGAEYAGMSADGQHVIFAANDALARGAVAGRDNLYEWNAGQALPELVSVLPDGEAYPDGQAAPLAAGPLSFGAGPGSYGGALSSDGTRAFWTGGGRIYMHELTGSSARTVEVSASQKGAGGTGTGEYWTANPSGSLVYFTSAEQLTGDSTAAAGSEDLYRYDTETGVLSDLTVDSQAGESAAVQGVLGAGESEGVPYVYFVAHGVLAAGAMAGANNMYVLRGGASEPVFITTLGSGVGGEQDDFTDGALSHTSRVSPNGLMLAFQSVQPLKGYDNVPASGACPIREFNEEENNSSLYGNSEGRCMEVFEYDARSGRLVCASCSRGGLPATGQSIVPYAPHLFQAVHGWESPTEQQRYLLDDGRLFFDSEDALLPQATDGQQNVYEYEPEGVGECVTAAAGGCLYLISTGSSSASSAFLDAGADGRDVFLLTSQQLVARDGDEATDVYDAREAGGFAEAQLPPCSGEACRPPVTLAPAIYGAPPSATFEGAGNNTTPLVVKLAAAKEPTAKKRTAKHKSKRKTRRKAGGKRRASGKTSAVPRGTQRSSDLERGGR